MIREKAGRKIPLIVTASAVSIATLALVLFSVTRTTGEGGFYHWFEAESAVSIKPPMEITDDEGASGGRCVELKEGMGAAIFGQGGGEAVYEIPFPEPGRYVVWARVYWTNGCGNSFFMKFGDDLIHFGEDSIFEEWHWVSLQIPEVEAAGVMRLGIVNREDGVKIDNLLVTADLYFVPHGKGGEIRIYSFNDGTAGDWEMKGPSSWEIRDGYGMDASPAWHLTAAQPGKHSYAIADFRSTGEFSFRCLARCMQPEREKRDVRIIFGYRDEKRYWFSDFTDGSVVLGRVEDAVERGVESPAGGTKPFVRLDRDYHLFEVAGEPGILVVKYDGVIVSEIRGSTVENGAFGIGSRYGDVYFDDIIIGREHDFSYSENFYYDDERPVELARNWRPESGSWTRSSTHGPHTYNVEARTVAASLAGNRLWRNYRFGAVASGDGESGIGIIFYCIDNQNSYLFRWGGTGSTKSYAGKKQLLRVLNGQVTVLAEADGGYDAYQWYRLDVYLKDGRITACIDDRPVFDIFDRDLLQGMVGLYLDGPTSVPSGFPETHFWPSVYGGSEWRQNFPITIEGEEIRQRVYICYQDSLNYYALRWGGGPSRDDRARVQLVRILGGIETVLDERRNDMEYGATYSVMISYLGGRIEAAFVGARMIDVEDLLAHEVMRFTIQDPLLEGGKLALGTGRRVNGMFDDIRVSTFKGLRDDFSFAIDGQPVNWSPGSGSWTVENGSLSPLTSEASSIFSEDGGWSDYTIDVSCRTALGDIGEAGVFFNYRNDSSHCVFRMVSLGDSTLYSIVSVRDGTAEELDRFVGSMERNVSHTVRIESNRGLIEIYLDGARILRAFDAVVRGGRIGLYAAHAVDVFFDHVLVSPGVARRSMDMVNNVFASRDRYLPGTKMIDGWVDERGEFEVRGGALFLDGSRRRTVIRRAEHAFLDDLSVTFDVSFEAGNEAACGVFLAADDSIPESGYLFLVESDRALVARDGSIVVERDIVPIDRRVGHAIAFERRKGYLLGFIDGDCIAAYPEEYPLRTEGVGLVVDGGSLLLDNIRIRGYPRYYYDFDCARWCANDLSHWRIGSGRWGVISSISYSLFGEKDSDRDALLWHKEPLEGDFAVLVQYSSLHTSDGGEFIIALCADGEEMRGGYVLNVMYEIEKRSDGSQVQNVAVRLVKDGRTVDGGAVTVPQEGLFMLFRVEKRGSGLSVHVAGEDVLTYRDGAIPAARILALGITGPPSRATFFNTIAVFDLY